MKIEEKEEKKNTWTSRNANNLGFLVGLTLLICALLSAYYEGAHSFFEFSLYVGIIGASSIVVLYCGVRITMHLMSKLRGVD